MCPARRRPLKVYQWLDPRSCTKNSLRHCALPSPKFYRGEKVLNLALILIFDQVLFEALWFRNHASKSLKHVLEAPIIGLCFPKQFTHSHLNFYTAPKTPKFCSYFDFEALWFRNKVSNRKSKTNSWEPMMVLCPPMMWFSLVYLPENHSQIRILISSALLYFPSRRARALTKKCHVRHRSIFAMLAILSTLICFGIRIRQPRFCLLYISHALYRGKQKTSVQTCSVLLLADENAYISSAHLS